ncbi:hypothetical protein MMC32_001286 [Xylographa parallela]|nr:hypothetical protein [Xylographa parallela]
MHLLRSVPIVFIEEIDGLATGAGNELAMQIDMRLADPNARLRADERGEQARDADGDVACFGYGWQEGCSGSWGPKAANLDTDLETIGVLVMHEEA